MNSSFVTSRPGNTQCDEKVVKTCVSNPLERYGRIQKGAEVRTPLPEKSQVAICFLSTDPLEKREVRMAFFKTLIGPS